ncbi:DUF2795 domain-containing protein [Pseudonocardia acidicola]|uniref:DUF2795 domain-containing protein n=1 Tax=Pseudonocardia acidicola TaxID=2724939 RepID=A0ABX1S7E5_9PSEU|nr:DUF2795 domain-containing protein [Pseudonocardia acidicola]NMH97020.1 DUF2795 domain-containing protein [Pseudonocardia acidicola]
MAAYTTRDRLKKALIDADYPATKEQLIETALRNGADEMTLKALRSIPPVDYHSFTEVEASVEIRDDDPELDAALKAERRRMHTHPGLSERTKDVPAPNPIVEELGENRGS